MKSSPAQAAIPSLILNTATRFLMPLLVLFSLFILLRGHNLPGGGFIGGLIAASAFALYAIAHDVAEARRALPLDPLKLIALGLLTSASSGIFSMVAGKPFMTGLWIEGKLPVIGSAGTPLMFDTGVYLLVFGIALTIIFTLAEE